MSIWLTIFRAIEKPFLITEMLKFVFHGHKWQRGSQSEWMSAFLLCWTLIRPHGWITLTFALIVTLYLLFLCIHTSIVKWILMYKTARLYLSVNAINNYLNTQTQGEWDHTDGSKLDFLDAIFFFSYWLRFSPVLVASQGSPSAQVSSRRLRKPTTGKLCVCKSVSRAESRSRFIFNTEFSKEKSA